MNTIDISAYDGNYAAIDIGSNAARMLINQLNFSTDSNGEVVVKKKKIQLIRIPVRLGLDTFTDGKISPMREKLLMRTMKVFRQMLIIYDVKDYRACATASMRSAKNGKKVMNRIKDETKFDIDIISGDEEAQIIRDNFDLDINKNYICIDVGGGSTELSVVSGGELKEAHSFNIGTIRILNDCVPDNEWENMAEMVKAAAKKYPDINLVGSGGNINKLYRMSPQKEKRKEKVMLATLKKIYSNLNELSVEQRISEYNLRPDRADVIVPAAKIFIAMAEAASTDKVIVPIVGLVDGVVNEIASKIITEYKAQKKVLEKEIEN